ncbi:MAG: hypothetical protein JSR18_08850 [Proteobacteria bacterium]|nr:hypothetical protein [Pseudomonadota bacterium]
MATAGAHHTERGAAREGSMGQRSIRMMMAVAAAAGMTTATAATYTYPGAAPCATTLQACVDGVGANDTIEVAQNVQIPEFVTISQSLALTNAPGYTPSVQGLLVLATTTSVTFAMHGFTGTQLRGVLGAGGGSLAVTVTGNAFQGGDYQSGVEMYDNNANPGSVLTALISGNTFAQSSTSVCADALSVVATSAQMNATITGNQFTMGYLSQCGAIDVVAGGAGGGTALIGRNLIQGADFDYGIMFRHFGANPTDTTTQLSGTITNNLVVGESGNTGAPGGIVLSADGYNAKLSAQVINNTVADGRIGVLVSARTDLGAALGGRLANNIVAGNSSYDIGIDPGLAGFVADHNMTSGSTHYGSAFGPGNLSGNPDFVSPTGPGGSYQLQLDSPAINSGDTSALDPSLTLDLAGNARIVSVIDRGAYESASTAPPIPVPGPQPVPTLERGALVALLLLLLAVSSATLRRRR